MAFFHFPATTPRPNGRRQGVRGARGARRQPDDDGRSAVRYGESPPHRPGEGAAGEHRGRVHYVLAYRRGHSDRGGVFVALYSVAR